MTLLSIDDVLRAKDVPGMQHGKAGGAVGGLFDAEAPIGFRSTPLASGVDLLPTQYSLGSELTSSAHVDVRLEDVIRRFSDKYDYILLDAQAGVDSTALAAAKLAADVIIVSEYDPVSAQGVKRMEQLYPAVFSSDRTWVLYNKVLPDIAESLGSLLRVERRLNPIPWDADVVRAYVSSTVPVNMDVPNGFTLAIIASIETLFGRQLHGELENWRSSTAKALRAPIDDRVKALERELDDLERARIELRTLTATYPRRRQLAIVLFAIVAVGLGATVLTVTPAGTTRWITLVVVGVVGILTAVVPMFVETVSPGETEAELDLARLERQTHYLNDELRQLALSSSSAVSALRGDSER